MKIWVFFQGSLDPSESWTCAEPVLCIVWALVLKAFVVELLYLAGKTCLRAPVG